MEGDPSEVGYDDDEVNVCFSQRDPVIEEDRPRKKVKKKRKFQFRLPGKILL
jgi:hypothetical protein